MAICASCGHDNSERAKFCEECGVLLRVQPAREQRKTVTVLFCDITGSTALGESTDPEALRALLARYFERMKGIVEHHGGTVEKFIGDAVMAVFGVPVVHEDDALRAARAALEMRDALPELGVAARIGANTGEVVTGTAERLATGDAVNVAARLEQAAQPGEILIGDEMLRLVRDAVEAEPVDPLELKGKAEPVRAYLLVAVDVSESRAPEADFVGRRGELATLRQIWKGVRDDRRCELVTIVGEPGVGKSRLAAEFLAAADARVVSGRCLSYGEGITYRPVLEVLKQLDALPSDPTAAAAVRSLLGESTDGTSAEEIAWAFRKLLEEQMPLVCVFDDIQWGEDTFLDLVEHVALLSSGASILLLCLARSELADRRPHWPVALRLDPLGDGDVDALIPEAIPAELREKIGRVAGGNPLFVTEMVAMAREAEGDVAVPPNLKALLAARLDQLEAPERSVLERGAVEGETFHRGSVQALSTGGGVTPQLASLVRKKLVRPDEANLPGDDAFRFRHLLIRDAAYDALPKAARAELHQRFAGWLEGRGDGLPELDEILGYHLEQAALYKQQLGVPDPRLAELAGEHLANAGRRAWWRGDAVAAAGLLERALTLLRPLRLDVALELELANAHRTSREAAEIADAAAERARAAGDRGGEALAGALAAHYRFSLDEVERHAGVALPLLEQAEDHAGLVQLWWSLGFGVANTRWQFEDMARAAENALHHAELAGRLRSGLFALDMALVWGPRPADEALETLDAFLPRASSARPLLNRAWLLAMLGRFDEAREVGRDAGKRLSELGEFHAGEQLAEVATLAGDHEEAVAQLGDYCRWLEERGELAFLSTAAGRLGRALCAVGDYEQAETSAKRGRELGDESDIATQAWWRQALARVEAFRGQHAEAEPHAREAVAIAGSTDALNAQADSLCDLSEVLAAAGRTNDAADALEQALERYERKKNLAMVAQVRPNLEALRAALS